MEHFMGEEWQLKPAGGATGEAYAAEQGDQKIFIKRNSSPFLAVLSAEGIVPKLLWTKRLENGDVITAQKWVDGERLEQTNMKEKRVALLLSKIHRSKELLDMFMRMGNEPLTARDILASLKEKKVNDPMIYPVIEKALGWLDDVVNQLEEEAYVVCHADINHNNWINNSNNQLYLIDWDGAKVADPALDLAPLLYLYIPKNKWESWLAEYGINLSDSLREKYKWYMSAQCVELVFFHRKLGEEKEAAKWLAYLKEFYMS